MQFRHCLVVPAPFGDLGTSLPASQETVPPASLVHGQEVNMSEMEWPDDAPLIVGIIAVILAIRFWDKIRMYMQGRG